MYRDFSIRQLGMLMLQHGMIISCCLGPTSWPVQGSRWLQLMQANGKHGLNKKSNERLGKSGSSNIGEGKARNGSEEAGRSFRVAAELSLVQLFPSNVLHNPDS